MKNLEAIKEQMEIAADLALSIVDELTEAAAAIQDALDEIRSA